MMLCDLVVAGFNLKTISLKMHQVDGQDGARVPAKCIHKYCLKFQELAIHCVHEYLDISLLIMSAVISFIPECSIAGLTKLAV